MTIVRFRISFARLSMTILAGFLLLGAARARAEQSTQTWLMLNPSSQETLFVTDPAERTKLTKDNWKTNGTGAFLAMAQPATLGMQRLVKVSANGNDRIFAAGPEQVADATKAGYVSEGVLGQVALTQLKPMMIAVYHFTKDSQNLWLLDQTGQTWVEKNGWKPRGIAFWIWPVATP